jgi:adenylate cyclase
MKQPVERRLAAILAADVAGYSRLMGADEEGTHERLRALFREVVDPKTKEHRGRIVKNTGDGILADFASVVDAVRCAVAMLQGMAERNTAVATDNRIEFRVGIHQGDIIVEDGDIFGDGVNVAARLEGLAEPGGICVSARVQEDVAGRLDLTFEDMGEQQVKNIARPVRVYRVRQAAAENPVAALQSAPPLPDKPSLAVLPFQNMTGDAEQDYFVDGIVEEITTAISRLPWLFVIARNSSFTYKSRAVDVKQVARELGVRYVLEGSVRKAQNRVRITGQLIDTATGAHLWADRFDGALDDIFELQDQVASSVAGAIEPRLRQAEIERAIRKPTENLDAYDMYLRALVQLRRNTEQGTHEASVLAKRALQIDPSCLPAASLVAHCRSNQRLRGWGPISETDVAEALRLAKHTIEVGSDDPDALSYAGWALAVLAGERALGVRAIDRAVALNPNSTLALGYKGMVEVYSNRPGAAIEAARSAMRLSPLDAWHVFEATLALAYLTSARYEEAIEAADKALTKNPRAVHVLGGKAVACIGLGRVQEASECVKQLCELRPGSTIANIGEAVRAALSPEVLAIYLGGLRKAGLPEE